MSFLRRLLGGDDESKPPAAPPQTAAELQEEEHARELELLRADAQRLDDDLIQRQMRYSGHSWTPPAQGTGRRADDEDAEAE